MDWIHLAQERGTFRVRQVVWLPWQHSPNGRKMNILNEKFDFLHLTNVKLLRKTKGNSINRSDFFKVCSLCQGRPQ